MDSPPEDTGGARRVHKGKNSSKILSSLLREEAILITRADPLGRAARVANRNMLNRPESCWGGGGGGGGAACQVKMHLPSRWPPRRECEIKEAGNGSRAWAPTRQEGPSRESRRYRFPRFAGGFGRKHREGLVDARSGLESQRRRMTRGARD